MSLQAFTHLNVDFCDKKYILVNAKQYDKKSRFLEISCYNRGELFHLNSKEHSAYVRYKKSDNNSVFNFCEINLKGNVLVELTEQMLAASGICYVDLVIVGKGNAQVNTETGEIIAINNSAILSTMTFCVDVTETAVENSDIESSYEFNGLNIALEKAEAGYAEVVRLAKSYAVGDAGGIRTNEETDNSKYYYELSLRNSNNVKISEANAKTSETNARISETNAKISENTIKSILDNLNNAFTPMGTISFSELGTVEKITGFIYNIRDDFVTDSRFAEGSGMSYTAGTNVYVRADGLFDCFGGSLPIATVNEVKTYLSIE